MTAPLAVLGIESQTLTIVVDLLIVFAVVLYLALIYWTYKDAARRIQDPTLVGCAVAVSLVPYIGTLVYIIVRPVESLEDVQERELELEATKLRLYELESALCPHCDYPVESDFLRCPSCLRKLKERCKSCSRPLDRAWTICPYCETEVAPARAGGRRGARTAAPAAAGGSRGSRPPAPEPPADKRDADKRSGREGTRRESGVRAGAEQGAGVAVTEGARARQERAAKERPGGGRGTSDGATDVLIESGSNGSSGDAAKLGGDRAERATPARSGRATKS